MPLVSPDEVRHRLPIAAWPIALFLALAPMKPVIGWVLGGVEFAAIPMLIALIGIARATERETGVVVHQRQVVAAISGRFGTDRWASGDAAAGAR